MPKKKQNPRTRPRRQSQVAFENVLVNLRVDTAIHLRVPMGVPDDVVTAAVEACWNGSNLVIQRKDGWLTANPWVVQKSENLEYDAIVCQADPATTSLTPRDAKAIRAFWDAATRHVALKDDAEAAP